MRERERKEERLDRRHIGKEVEKEEESCTKGNKERERE